MARALVAAAAVLLGARADFRVAFDVEITGGNGSFVLVVHEDWAPIGAAHFKELVEAKFYDDTRFFRVIPSFMVQFGLSGQPDVNEEWRPKTILDEDTKQKNLPGYVSFARTGAPNSRSTQLFINYVDNSYLDHSGFAPFAVVDGQGMDVVRKIFDCGEKPTQRSIEEEGNAYLDREFPQLSRILQARLLEEPVSPDSDRERPAKPAAPEDLGDGLTIARISPGDGVTFPRKGDQLAVHYTASLSDGRVYDSTLDRGQPYEFEEGVGKVLKGLDLALPKMSLGERALIHIPAKLGWGDKGTGDGKIPPGADLDYDLQLLRINDTEIGKLPDANASTTTTYAPIDPTPVPSGANSTANSTASDGNISNASEISEEQGRSAVGGSLLLIVAVLAFCAGGVWMGFRMLTDPARTPLPLLDEEEMAEVGK